MTFRKDKSEEKELWIISLDLGNGHESEEFVETSEENAIEKIKDLIAEEEQPIIDENGDGSFTITDYITVAKVKVVEVKYSTTKTVIGLK